MADLLEHVVCEFCRQIGEVCRCGRFVHLVELRYAPAARHAPTTRPLATGDPVGCMHCAGPREPMADCTREREQQGALHAEDFSARRSA